jgi:hypothetical protein
MTGESVLSAGLVKVGLADLVAQDTAERSIFAPGYSADAARCWHNRLEICGRSARASAFGIPEVPCRVGEEEAELGHVVLAAAARSPIRARNAMRFCSSATICPRSNPRGRMWSRKPVEGSERAAEAHGAASGEASSVSASSLEEWNVSKKSL